MFHLLAAIHFLLCGAPAAATPTRNRTSEGVDLPIRAAQPEGVAALSVSAPSIPVEEASRGPPMASSNSEESSSSSGAIASDSAAAQQQQQDSSSSSGSSSSVLGESIEESAPSNVADSSAGREQERTLTTTDGAAVPAKDSDSARQSTNNSGAATSIHERILNVVSEEGAAAICRIFSGLTPGDASINPWSLQIAWGMGQSNQPQQSQWPLLCKIVTRLFW